jgi:hypothetical protein
MCRSCSAAGIRYLDNLTHAPVWLDGPCVIEGIGVTHLIYDVRPLED